MCASPLNVPFALVAEDEAILRIDTCEILQEAGFRTLEAGDVSQAIDLLQTHYAIIELLFTDVQMPGPRDGFSLAREVAERWPAIGILVASGRTRPQPGELPPKAIFIDKPFSAHSIHERLKQLLPDCKKQTPGKGR